MSKPHFILQQVTLLVVLLPGIFLLCGLIVFPQASFLLWSCLYFVLLAVLAGAGVPLITQMKQRRD
jgi:hypothetical protein